MNRSPSTSSNRDRESERWTQPGEQTQSSSPQTDPNRQISPQAKNNDWNSHPQDSQYKSPGTMQQTSNRSSPRYPPQSTNSNSLPSSSSWRQSSDDRSRPHTNNTNKQDTAKSNQQWGGGRQRSDYRPAPEQQQRQTYKSAPGQQQRPDYRPVTEQSQRQTYRPAPEQQQRPDYRPVTEQSQRQTYRPAPEQQQRPPHRSEQQRSPLPTSSQAPTRKEAFSKADEDQLLKNMQALSTNDQPDTMEDDDYVIECKASPLKMDQVETTFERYETMRGGCRFQSIDGTTALVIFGHPSTAKKAWMETKHSTIITIRSYKGPMDIIEDVPIVRKSAMNQRPRPSNLVAQRLIHGSLGLKRPTRPSTTKQ